MKFFSYHFAITALSTVTLSVGCGKNGGGEDTGSSGEDADNDGFGVDVDCDDTDAAVNPGAIDDLFVDRDCVEGISSNSLALADYSFVGENIYDVAGLTVSSAGDVDGDGLDDLLVGAVGNNDGGESAGKAYLILGSSLGSASDIDLSDTDYSFVGENSDDQSGMAVSSAGDVDGDGLDDLLVGAVGNDDGDNQAGKAYLILSGL